MIDIMNEAEAISEDIQNIREKFHMHPELGNHEFETANCIVNCLESYGIRVERILDTAVVGILEGGLPGKTVALRADMDALPVTETTGASFSSNNEGIMHACGHDVHMAAALGAARILSNNRDIVKGTVKFIFQPDEEGSGGAERMIECGCLEDVEAIFGAHVVPDVPLGSVAVKYGKFYAASNPFQMFVKGKSAHGATPEKGIDALAAAAELVCMLKRIPDKFPEDRCVVTVGKFISGTAENIMSGETELGGIIRSLGPDMRLAVKEELRECAKEIESKYGVTIDVNIRESYPGVVNDIEMTELAENAFNNLFGNENVSVLEQPTMTTEDFGLFLEKVSGSFYHIGAGCELPLHNSGFLPDKKAAVIATAAHTAVVAAYLGMN